jgi:hypothetical protein
VILTLGGVGVGESLLTPEAPTYEFRVSAGEARARGALRYVPAAPPLMSSLDAELTELAPRSTETPFRGRVAAWVAAEDLIFHESTFALSPELFARTQVRGWSRSNAMINLYAGSVLLASVATTQGSPVARLDQPIRFGDALVEAGATFTLTVPTAAQRGQMFLQATYQSGNTPSTTISSAIAVWP